MKLQLAAGQIEVAPVMQWNSESFIQKVAESKIALPAPDMGDEDPEDIDDDGRRTYDNDY